MKIHEPKLGEWTKNAVDQAELRSLREKVMELEQQLAAAEKALSEEVDCVHKTLMQLAAEREKVEWAQQLAEEAYEKGMNDQYEKLRLAGCLNIHAG